MPAVPNKKIGVEACCPRGTTARAHSKRGSKATESTLLALSANLSSPGSVSTRLYALRVSRARRGTLLAAASGGMGISVGMPLVEEGACQVNAFILVPELPASTTRTYCGPLGNSPRE